MRKLLPLILILLTSLAAPGQGLSVTELQAKAKSEKLKDLIISYSKFKDQSIIITKPENLVGSWEGAGAIVSAGMVGVGGQMVLMVNVGAGFKGPQLTQTVNDFVLGFQSLSKGKWQFLKGDQKLYLLYDEHRLEMEPIASDADISIPILASGVDTTESLYFRLTRSDLEAIAAAKKIEMQLGNSKPRLWKNNIAQRIRSLLTITKL